MWDSAWMARRYIVVVAVSNEILLNEFEVWAYVGTIVSVVGGTRVLILLSSS